jgi:hypothetical protein
MDEPFFHLLTNRGVNRSNPQEPESLGDLAPEELHPEGFSNIRQKMSI